MLLAATDSVSVSTVLISVLSSATVGGIIVAVLTGRHERDQQLRDKMLGAAADFATSMAKLRAMLEAIDRGAKEGVLEGRALDTALVEYEAIWGQASAQLVLVQMLYHPASAVYGEAGKIWGFTVRPAEAREFAGDPLARDKAMGGGFATAEAIRYLGDFSYRFARYVWEAIDNPRRTRGRRSGRPGMFAASRPVSPSRPPQPPDTAASDSGESDPAE
jgi:hypothetical protein